MDIIDKIKQVDLPDYLKKRYGIELTSRGSTNCPFHPPDIHRSFSVYKKNDGIWRWRDFHDDAQGTIIDLVARLENKTPQEAIELLKKDRFINQNTNDKTNSEKQATCKVERTHVYKDYDGNPVYRKSKFSDGSWIFEHWTDETWKPRKGNYKTIPYNLHKFGDSDKFIICEGEKDADTINSLKIAWLATSAPFGKSSWPDELTKYFNQKSALIFLYDVGNEDFAKKHALNLKKKYPDIEIGIAKVPMENYEDDITDYLNQFQNLEEKRQKLLGVINNSEIIDSADEPEDGIKPILIDLDSIQPEPVEWLWFNRIPVGKLSLIVGDPGTGKSFLTIYMASHITTGEPWPDIGAPILKGSVIILTAEDGLADTVRKRADASGADVQKIRILEGVITKNEEQEFFNLIDHLPALEQAVIKTDDVRLIIIDPITSYLGKIDSHKNSQVRGVLAPLSNLAEKHKIAIVAVSHLNKSTVLQAIYRTMGSLAFAAAARSVWAISNEEDDSGSIRRLFMPLKTNLSVNPTSLAFKIIDSKVIFDKDPLDLDIEETLSGEGKKDKSALIDAKTWLKEALREGPIRSTEIFRMAKENEISTATLRRAQKELRIEAYKEGILEKGKWYWKLPEI